MLRCGKHSGRPFADVAAGDPSYCAWVLRERANGTRLSRDLKAFANYVQDVHGGVLVVGTHSGRFFDEVLRDDADAKTMVMIFITVRHDICQIFYTSIY